MDDDALRHELEVALAARREVGPEMEDEVLDAFVVRIERRLEERAQASEAATASKREHQSDMVLGAMVIGVPMLAVAGGFTGLPGIVVVCVALVLITIIGSR